jgi:hypothetical protein
MPESIIAFIALPPAPPTPRTNILGFNSLSSPPPIFILIIALPFAHITIREKELFGTSGTSLDYYSLRATSAVDFRADNDKNFESLEKNSIDLYSSFKSIYLQDRENKIKNSIEDQDEWGNLDN